jgi:hypothetical protein
MRRKDFLLRFCPVLPQALPGQALSSESSGANSELAKHPAYVGIARKFAAISCGFPCLDASPESQSLQDIIPSGVVRQLLGECVYLVA